MKNRTVEELHDKYIGYKKFAKVCDILIEDGFNVTNIKEYNEKFKFDVNGIQFEYSKDWKSSASAYINYIAELLKQRTNILKKLAKED